MPPADQFICFVNPFFKQFAIDRALVKIEERDVIVSSFVKQDDELDEVGIGLLPEWFLALPKEVVQQARDVIGERIRVQAVVERVVAAPSTRFTSI
jgi:hypothetical protein